MPHHLKANLHQVHSTEYTWWRSTLGGGVLTLVGGVLTLGGEVLTLGGVHSVESTRWSLLGGVYSVESTRWSTLPFNGFPTKYPFLSMFSLLKLQYLPLSIYSSLNVLPS